LLELTQGLLFHENPTEGLEILERIISMEIRTSKIEITSLVTRIATYIRALVGAQFTYLDTPRETFDEEHFVQAHLVKRVEGELVMLYPHSSTTIVLPCQVLGLYQVKKFTLNLASEDDAETIRPSQDNTFGPRPVTRSRTRRSERNLIPESTTYKHRHPAEQYPLVATGCSHSLAEASPQCLYILQLNTLSVSPLWEPTNLRHNPSLELLIQVP
jgi:hypothetical protein